jgi:hypothetical protein
MYENTYGNKNNGRDIATLWLAERQERLWSIILFFDACIYVEDKRTPLFKLEIPNLKQTRRASKGPRADLSSEVLNKGTDATTVISAQDVVLISVEEGTV